MVRTLPRWSGRAYAATMRSRTMLALLVGCAMFAAAATVGADDASEVNDGATPSAVATRQHPPGRTFTVAAVGDFLMGVLTGLDAAVNEPADVVQGGIADVEYGGVVTRGAPLTSDATGRAVVAAPAAGVNNRIVGFAEVSGVLGDIGAVRLAIGFMQG